MATSSVLHDYVLDPLERAGATFVEQFVVLLLPTMVVAGAIVKLSNYGTAADIAGFAAIVSLVTSVLTFPIPKLSTQYDLLLRVLKTFLQSLLGTMGADKFTHSVVHADWRSAFGIALVVAMVSLLKGLAALAAPWTTGSSLLPSNAGVFQFKDHKAPEHAV